MEPILYINFEVLAYDEGGYGDNRTRTFSVGEDAINYAKSLTDNYRPVVYKRITMKPIDIKIYDYKDKNN